MDKINKIQEKIHSRIKEFKQDEKIFLSSSLEIVNGNSYLNMVKSSNLLYNTDSFLQNEKDFLFLLKKGIQKKCMKRINDFRSKTKIETSKYQIDTICHVCSSGDDSESNLIVFCSGCDVSAHQECIGLKRIPQGEWKCDSCKHFKKKGQFIRCLLCPCRGGVFYKSNIFPLSNFIKIINKEYWTEMKAKSKTYNHISSSD